MSEKGPFYDSDLHSQLEDIVQNYERDREEYLSATECDRADRFAKAVLESSEQLMEAVPTDPDLDGLKYEISKGPCQKEHLVQALSERVAQILHSDLSDDQKRAAIQNCISELPSDPEDEDSPLRLVWERFCIDLAWHSVGNIVEGASRIFGLYALVLNTRPSEATQTFLVRLGRCYIWGFDPECVILCRSVLDTACRDAVDDDKCEDLLGKRGGQGFTLNERILVASKLGIIDDETRETATRVKQRGDKAVHLQPGITKDVLGTIRDTMYVLEELNARRKQAG